MYSYSIDFRITKLSKKKLHILDRNQGLAYYSMVLIRATMLL